MAIISQANKPIELPDSAGRSFYRFFSFLFGLLLALCVRQVLAQPLDPIAFLSPYVERGEPWAMLEMARSYYYGSGTVLPVDKKKAADWYKKADSAGATYQAAYVLGLMYSLGDGVPEDDWEAIRWYTKAAQAGNSDAQFNLGVMYDSGEGVRENDTEAARFYRLAADQGDDDAQLNLGILYWSGRGVPEDLVQAYKWWNLSSAAGNDQARKNKEIVVERMTKEQIAEAQRLSSQWEPTIQTTNELR